MKRAFAAAGILAIVGVALFVGPLVLIEPAEATYYVDAHVVDSVPDDATVVPADDTDAAVREALGNTGGVAVGHEHPSLPGYVRHDDQVYQLVLSVADPGGGGAVLALASFGLGLVAFGAAAAAAVLGLWRRYVR